MSIEIEIMHPYNSSILFKFNQVVFEIPSVNFGRISEGIESA